MRRISKRITKEEVEHIAQLARIELTTQEKELFTDQFNTIIDYFHVIDEVETKNIAPTLHILDLTNVFREDVVEASLPKDAVLVNSPMKDRRYFKAPKIV